MNKGHKEAQETKKRILEVAAALFSKGEYADVTVDSICEVCGVSKGAFYHHFKSKDEIAAVYCLGFVVEQARIAAGMIGEADTRSILCRFMESCAHAMDSHSVAWSRIHVRVVAGWPDIRQSKEETPQWLLRQILEDGVRRGELSGKYSLDFGVDLIMSLISGLCLCRCVREGETDLLLYAREYADMAYNLLKAD